MNKSSPESPAKEQQENEDRETMRRDFERGVYERAAKEQPGELTEDEKHKIVTSLLLQLWITLPQVPAGTMPNYEQAWDIAKSVLDALPPPPERP